MTKRLTYSRTKPEPRKLKFTSALLSTVIALRKSSGCAELTTTEGVWKYAVMRDSSPSGSWRRSVECERICKNIQSGISEN